MQTDTAPMYTAIEMSRGIRRTNECSVPLLLDQHPITPSAGLCLEEQLVDEVPVTEYDFLMDYVMARRPSFALSFFPVDFFG